MFKDFDYISPELAARLEAADDHAEDATRLNDEMQDLRIRGYGD